MKGVDLFLRISYYILVTKKEREIPYGVYVSN